MFSHHFRIGKRQLGKGERCFVVAEIGTNHNGDVEIALEMIERAEECGVDAVKFQKRDIESILTVEGFNKPYYGDNSFGQTYGEHRMALELSDNEYRDLKTYANSLGLEFFASVWDEKSADFMESIGVPCFKIASADVTNIPLIRHVAKKRKPIIISTGMSEWREIQEAVKAVEASGNQELILLQCVSTYPARPEQLNLSAMKTFDKTFRCLVGYSGHANNIWDGPVAVVMGACMIEKHFTLDRAMKGPDHAASLEPSGLMRIVRDIRELERAIGSGKKHILDEEKEIRKKLGKSVVAMRDIAKGETITRAMLTMKSPALGLSGLEYDKIVGKSTIKLLHKDEYVQLGDVE